MVLKNSNTLQIQNLLTMGAKKIKNKLNTFYSQSTKLGTKANRSKKKKKSCKQQQFKSNSYHTNVCHLELTFCLLF